MLIVIRLPELLLMGYSGLSSSWLFSPRQDPGLTQELMLQGVPKVYLLEYLVPGEAFET